MEQNLFSRIGKEVLALGFRLKDWLRRGWTEDFGDKPHLTPWQNALRGAALGSASVLALGLSGQGLAQGGPDFGSTNVQEALGKAFGPIIQAGCYVYNTAGPAVFLAAGIAVLIGFILKALQARFWGLFVWGGIVAAVGTGIVLAFISIFGNPKQSCSGQRT